MQLLEKGRDEGAYESHMEYARMYRESLFAASKKAYLPDAGGNCDHQGSPLGVRPFHCTSTGLTPAITPNVGNSSV